MRNTNSFNVSGRVIRIIDIKNGKLVTVGNNQDYQKEGEWINQSFYFTVAFFDTERGNRLNNIKEGDIVLVTGTMNTRSEEVDGQKRSSIGLVGVSIENFSVMTGVRKNDSDEEPGQKSKSKPKNKSSESKPKKRDVSQDEDEDEDDDDLGLFDN